MFKGRRESYDHYPTPRWCTLALINARADIVLGDTILDPTCGEGAILDVFRDGRHLDTRGIEIHSDRCDAARSAGHRVECADALRVEWPDAHWVVGNPPYTLAGEFARKAAEWAQAKPRRGAALLLRLSFLEPASGRGEMFRAHSPDVLILPRRPSFAGKGTDSSTSAWFVWPGKGRLVWLDP
jgi:hypothetical protein